MGIEQAVGYSSELLEFKEHLGSALRRRIWAFCADPGVGLLETPGNSRVSTPEIL